MIGTALVSLPPPTVVNGVVQQPWTPTITRGEWGTLRVEIGATWELVEVDDDVFEMQKFADGVDWTTYRGAATIIDSLSWADPFGEESGQITVPALTPWDLVDDAGLFGGPIRGGANIDIWRVLPAWEAAVTGVSEVGYWHGVVLDPGATHGYAMPAGVTYQLMGAMVAEMTTRDHQPQVLDDSRDIGQVLAQAVDTRDAYSRPSQGWRFDFQTATTGIEVRMRGSSGQMVVDFMRDVLAVARDGGHWWTIMQAYDENNFPRPRMYYLADVSTAPWTHTIRAGAPGLSWTPRQDVLADPNAVFGEGQRPDGGRWRGMVYPLLREVTAPTYPGPLSFGSLGSDVTALQVRLRLSGWPDVSPTGTFDDDTVTGLNALYRSVGHAQSGAIASSDDWTLAWSTGTGTTDLSSAYRRPLAVDPRVERWTYAADGSRIDSDNPYRDPSILRVEANLSYGDRITRGRATRNADRMIDDYIDGPLLTATATLTADLPDVSRHDLRVCGVLSVDYTHAGEDDGARALAMRVQRVEVSHATDERPVSLTLASRPYPALDLKTRIERDRSADSNPARSFFAQLHRASAATRDINGWDCESGAGLLRDAECTGGTWTVHRLIGAQRGNVQTITAQTTPATRYAMALFGAEIDADGVAALVAAPLTEAPTTSGWWAEVSKSDLDDSGSIIAWGMYTDACGYDPYKESDDPTPSETGAMEDGGGFAFESLKPPWLWLAVWAEDECTIDVTMRVQPEEL